MSFLGVPEELQDAIKVSITTGCLKETYDTISVELEDVLANGRANGMFSWVYEEEVGALNEMLSSIKLLLRWYE